MGPTSCYHSRRSFLRGSGLALTGFGLGSVLPSPFIEYALAGPLATNKRLLFIFLRGGNDGLNTLIPHGSPDYNATARPTLFIPSASALSLGNGFASLHPALSDLHSLHQAGVLASIHRVGYPSMSRSHFDGQRIWENGDPARPTLFEGWLYRYILEHGLESSGLLPVLTSQTAAPIIVRGTNSFLNVADPDNFDHRHAPPKSDKYQALWRATYGSPSGTAAYRQRASTSGLRLLDSLDEVQTWDQANWHPRDPNTGNYLFPVTPEQDPGGLGGSEFFRKLKTSVLALLESANDPMNGTRISGTELGAFDTHETQGTTAGIHAEQLRVLGYGIRSAWIALSGAANDPRNYPSIWNDTVIITLSEFGRTTQENSSGGTDHGSANAVFVAGGQINAGVYNCDSTTFPPGVVNQGPEGRDLLYRTDYRAIMWEILRDHMGADPAKLEAIFPGYAAANLTELGVIPG